MPDVIVVGGGPTGLLLAIELAVAGVEPLVLEAARDAGRRERSLGMRSLNVRTMQTLELRGLAEPMVQAQRAMLTRLVERPPDGSDEVALLIRMAREGRARGHFSGLPLIDDTPAEHPLVMLKQHQLEEVLADRAAQVGVRVRAGCVVVDVLDAGSEVIVTLADGRQYRAAYVVGCDGGRSVVRKRAGIAFPGTPPTMTGRTAVTRLVEPAAVRSTLRGPGGIVNRSLAQGEIATIEFDGGPEDREAPVTVAEMEASIRRAGGTAVTLSDVGAAIRYSDNTRQAETYRQGRILLAGDAAHVHSPIGGQGLNLGLQDAANLGWKLGVVVRGSAPADLLDTYTAERHPVATAVLRNTRAQVALLRPSPQVDALRDVLSEVLAIPAARRHFIAMANGTDIDYAPGSPHPLTGRFAPPLALPGGRSLTELLRDGRPVLVDLGGAHDVVGTGRVRVVSHGPRPDLSALLVRPDGYVALACSQDEHDALPGALARWFGST